LTRTDIAELGTRRDRQLVDFYFALAQRLRSRGYLKQLSASGVPGTTDSAILFELPDVLDALEADVPEIASLAASDIRDLLETGSSEAMQRLSALLSSGQLELGEPEA